MTLQQLTYFLAAARHGSFSAAAESPAMAQPSLSEQVRRLEAELGVPLFVRAGRGLELTEAGQLLRPHAERTLAEAEQAARVGARGARDHRRHGRLRHVLQRPSLPHRRPGAGLPRPLPGRADPRRRPELAPRSPTPSATARSRPGLIVLPIEDAGPRRPRRALREELLYISADPERVKEPVTIEKLAQAPLILADARWAAMDPTRRQLRERAQAGGRDDRAPDRGRVPDRGARSRRRAASATRSATASTLTGRGYARRLGTRAVRPADLRDVRVHHAPQRPSLARHARVHEAGGAAGTGARLRQIRSRHGRRDGCRRGISPDDLLAAGGRPADDRRQRGAGHAALGADGARDGRPAGARRLHHARPPTSRSPSPTRAASTPRRSSAATG